MIEIQNVTKVYGKQTVLSCVSATLEAGKIISIQNGLNDVVLPTCNMKIINNLIVVKE